MKREAYATHHYRRYQEVRNKYPDAGTTEDGKHAGTGSETVTFLAVKPFGNMKPCGSMTESISSQPELHDLKNQTDSC